MSGAGPFPAEPIPIGEIAAPPLVRLSDPRTLFGKRAARFRTLAQGHDLAPYLSFLAALSDVQHLVQDGLPEPVMPSAEARKQALDFGMPPLDRSRMTIDAARKATLDSIFSLSADLSMPDAAQAGLAQASAASGAEREAMLRAVLTDSIPAEALAAHVFVAAALQVDFARRAARLDAASLVPVGTGLCPSCGAPPVASQIVGWKGAHGTRFCACSLCSSLWHVVRITCIACGSTEGIAYEEVEGDGAIKAETCARCRSYVKILHQHTNPVLDPVADDVGSLALDLLLRETEYRRKAVNPFLLGY
ncbi:MAG: formate dehydrogenase accessory protein FdhE [Beijerinckiaceae bacterium]